MFWQKLLRGQHLLQGDLKQEKWGGAVTKGQTLLCALLSVLRV